MMLIDSWSAIIRSRAFYLAQTDLWYFKDRWDSLTSSQKGQLNSFRSALRDITSYHPDLSAAQANWPAAEAWFIVEGSEGDVLDWESDQ